MIANLVRAGRGTGVGRVVHGSSSEGFFEETLLLAIPALSDLTIQDLADIDSAAG